MSLLIKIERHLRRRGVSPSRFGREVAGDPRFVFDLRRGREPRADMQARVLDFITDSEHTVGAGAGTGAGRASDAPSANPASRSLPSTAAAATPAQGAA